MKLIKTTIYFLIVLIANSALAAVHRVPEEYATIQAAINACQDLDTVIIAPGKYSGSGNRNLSFNGKTITVRSTDPSDPQIVNTTVIDCEGKGRGFVFYMGENSNSTVTGLTVTNGYALLGGAIYCSNNSSPSITNCVIITNSAFFGGAIASTNSKSRPRIANCRITANSAFVGGGAIYCNGGSPKLENCIISGNYAPNGGAIYSHNPGLPVIANCTISENTASMAAGAIYCYKSSNLTINNSILWGNTATYASEVLIGNMGAATSIHISYCDIQDAEKNVILDGGCTVTWGLGNINVDPQFVESGYLNSDKIRRGSAYHLLKGSPCIDAGDPAFIPEPDETDIDGNPRISGAKIDIGADEYTAIEAEIKITPKTLNLESKGTWISCTIQLPNNDIANINAASIALNGNIKPVWSKADEQAQKLLVKFGRPGPEARDMSNTAQNPVLLHVSGKLNDGTDFEGTDTIRIVPMGGKR